MAEIDLGIKVKDAQAKQAFRNLEENLNRTTRAVEKSGHSVDGLFTKVGRSFDNIKNNIVQGMTSIIASTAGFAAAMEGGTFLKEMVNNAKEFSVAMKEVSTISKEVTANLEGYKQQLLDLTTRVPIGATEAAKALYQIVSAGQEGADAMHVLEVSAKAAIGGVTDTATAADTITTILNAYHMSATDAEKVSDMLFTTIRLGKTTMSELGASIAQAAPTAAAYGISIDQLLAAVATLTKQGVPTAMAMTQLNAIITQGVEVLGDGAFKGRTFAEALALIEQKSNGSVSALKDSVSNVRAMRAILSMTGESAQMAADDLAAMQQAAGAAEDAFAKMADTKSIQRLRNCLQEAIQPLADDMLKMSKDIANSISEAFESGTINNYIAVIEGLVAAYGVYRTALVANIALERAQALSRLASIKNTNMLALSYDFLKGKVLAANAAIMAHPYALAAAAAAALAVAIFKLNKETSTLSVKKKAQGEAEDYAVKKMAEEEVKTKRLIKATTDNNTKVSERLKKIDELNRLIPGYVTNLNKETGEYDANTNTLKAYNAELKKKYMLEGSRKAIENLGEQYAEQLVKIKEAERGLKQARENAAKAASNPQPQTSGGGVASGVLAQAGASAQVGAAVDYLNDLKRQAEYTMNAITELDNEIQQLGGTTPKTEENNTNGNGNGNGNGKGGNTEAVKQAADEQKLLDTMYAQSLKSKREYVDDMLQTTQYEIDAMAEGRAKTIAQLNLDTDKELEAIRRAGEDIKAEREKQARELWEAQNAEDIRKNGKTWNNSGAAEEFDANYKLDEVSADLLKSRTDAVIANYRRKREELQNEDFEAMNEYLQAFGTNEEKRKAIRAKADKEMAATDNQWLKKSIDEQARRDIADIQLDDLKKSIDWDYVFGDLENIPLDVLQDVTYKLEKFKETANDLRPDELKEVVEALNKIDERINTASPFTSYKEGRREYAQAQSGYNSSKYLRDMYAGMGDTKKVDEYEKKMQKYYKAMIRAEKKQKTAWKDSIEVASNYTKALDEVGEAIGGTAGECTQLAASAISAGLGMANGIKAFGEAASAAERSVAILAILEAVLKAISVVASILSFDGEAKKAEELKKEYEALTNVWQELIDKKKEYISIDYGSKAKEEYDEALRYYKEMEKLARSNAKQRLNVTNGSHSMEYRMWEGSYIDNKGRTWKDVAAEIRNLSGISLKSVSSFTKLTSEQLQWIKEHYVGLWASMDEDFRNYLEDIIQYGDEAKELGEKMQEAINGVSFDDFYDGFKEVVLDMESTTEDFAAKLEEYISTAILSSMLADKYKERIEALYKAWNEAAGGTTGSALNITPEEQKALQEQMQGITDDILAERKALIESFGWGGNEFATSFDDIRSSFLSLISDLTTDTEDFAENVARTISETMYNALLEQSMTSQYEPQIRDWFERYKKAIQDGADATELAALRSEYADLANQIKTTAEQIADLTGYAEAISKEQLEELQQKKTQTTLDSVKSDFKSLINSMDADTEDFAERFSAYMQSALLNAKLEELYNDQLKEWYNDFYEAMNSGEMTDEQYNDLKARYQAIAESAHATAEEIAKVTGAWDKSMKESLTQTTLDALKRDLEQLIMSFDTSAQDFADKFEDYLSAALLNARLDEILDEQLGAWYDKFAEAIANGLTDDDIEALRNEYNAIAESARDTAEEVAKITGAWDKAAKEQITALSFDSLKSEFKNAVTSMETEAKDFAESFAQYLQNALVEAKLQDLLNTELQSWYDTFAAYMEDGLTSEEIAQLKAAYESIYNEALSIRDAAAEITGVGAADLKKKLTQTDLDSVRNEFKSLLSNMENDSKAFGESFEAMIYDALLNAQMESLFNDRLEQWYEDFASWMAKGGDTTSEEYQSLLERYSSMGNEARTMAQDIAEAIGYSLDSFKDALTQTSYDSVRGDFESLLMDLDSDTKDFADNFSKYLQQALLEAQMGELLDDQLQSWYDTFAAYMEDGSLSDREIDQLREAYNTIVEDAIAQRDELAKITGYNTNQAYSQSATTAFEGMSQDTADELNGRFTALQIATETNKEITRQMAEQIAQGVTQLLSIASATSAQSENIEEIRNLMISTNSFLDDIAKYARLSYSDFGSKLDSMNSKLSKL